MFHDMFVYQSGLRRVQGTKNETSAPQMMDFEDQAKGCRFRSRLGCLDDVGVPFQAKFQQCRTGFLTVSAI